MTELNPGDVVHTASRHAPCTIKKLLGGGGQGEVFLVDIFGKDYALKWYLPSYIPKDPLLRTRLTQMLDSGAPSSHFIWPIELVQRPNGSSFGYVMPLYEARFRELTAYASGDVNPGFRQLITTGLNLTEAFQALHSKGLCYRDISFGNIGFDPLNGEIRIWDNDNVGIADQGTAVGGTKGFIAPEVARGHAAPNALSDLYSLAALLFQLFVRQHPLHGKLEADCLMLDDEAYRRLHVTQPLFIFDPVDKRNAPEPGWNDNAILLWPIYPEFFRKFFIRAFTVGLHNPQGGRVTIGEWRRALARLRDLIVPCPHCKNDNFIDMDVLDGEGKPVLRCWSCRRASRPPPRLHVNGHVVALNYDTTLFPHHLDQKRQFDFSNVVARIVTHPTDKTKAGLRNEDTAPWSVMPPGKDMLTVAPGRSVALVDGARILFGRAEGRISG